MVRSAAADTPAPPSASFAAAASGPSHAEQTSGSLYTRFDGERALQHALHLATDIGPRPSGGAAEWKTFAYVGEMLRQAGWRVTAQQGIPLGSCGLDTCNIIATHPHPAPGAQAVVLVGAHCDSIRLPVGGCPGANDNASGVGVLLEVARVLGSVELPYRLVLVCFGGEEIIDTHRDHHHYGSRHLARVWHEQGRLRPVRAMVTVDMVGRGTSLELRTANQAAQPLVAALEHAARRLGLQAQEVGGQRGSDHEPFAACQIPALWLYRPGDASNHTTADTLDRLSVHALEQAGRLLVHFLASSAWPP